jgi:hypothetical protein
VKNPRITWKSKYNPFVLEVGEQTPTRWGRVKHAYELYDDGELIFFGDTHSYPGNFTDKQVVEDLLFWMSDNPRESGGEFDWCTPTQLDWLHSERRELLEVDHQDYIDEYFDGEV